MSKCHIVGNLMHWLISKFYENQNILIMDKKNFRFEKNIWAIGLDIAKCSWKWYDSKLVFLHCKPVCKTAKILWFNKINEYQHVVYCSFLNSWCYWYLSQCLTKPTHDVASTLVQHCFDVVSADNIINCLLSKDPDQTEHHPSVAIQGCIARKPGFIACEW